MEPAKEEQKTADEQGSAGVTKPVEKPTEQAANKVVEA